MTDDGPVEQNIYKPMRAEKRWLASVFYKTRQETMMVQHKFEELPELHKFIEDGPDWRTLEKIVITLSGSLGKMTLEDVYEELSK